MLTRSTKKLWPLQRNWMQCHEFQGELLPFMLSRIPHHSSTLRSSCHCSPLPFWWEGEGGRIEREMKVNVHYNSGSFLCGNLTGYIRQLFTGAHLSLLPAFSALHPSYSSYSHHNYFFYLVQSAVFPASPLK